jgi:predicted SAM-dependent methyltransferase
MYQKIHACCGDVYLNGYLNVDIVGSVIDDPCGWEEYGTTLGKYYTKPLDLETVRYKKEEQPIDMKVDLRQTWPFFSNSVSEVVMIQSIEHFTKPEAEFIVREIYRILIPRGQFIFDFPDIIGTIIEYQEQNVSWDNMIRMIYGTWVDDFARHKYAYNSTSFYRLLKKVGNWKTVDFREVVKHDYPTIGGIALK